MLDVRDDGVGFDAATPARAGGGFGLTAMRQRVQRLAGHARGRVASRAAGTAISRERAGDRREA